MIDIFIGVVLFTIGVAMFTIGYLLGFLICERKFKVILGKISNVWVYDYAQKLIEIDKLSGGK